MTRDLAIAEMTRAVRDAFPERADEILEAIDGKATVRVILGPQESWTDYALVERVEATHAYPAGMRLQIFEHRRDAAPIARSSFRLLFDLDVKSAGQLAALRDGSENTPDPDPENSY